jgi:hypothetical protein
MATLYNPDGTTQTVEPTNPKKGFQLRELYRLLECDMIQIIYPPDSETIMVIDEEGKFQPNYRRNAKATEIMGPNLFVGDEVVGIALVCKETEVQ